MWRHSLAVAAIDARILRKDPAPVAVMIVLPLLFVPFFAPGASAQLAAAGRTGLDGAAYAVPSLAVLFALLCVQQVIGALYRDRQWGTWDRLRASPAPRSAVLVGKSLTALGAQVAQLLVVLIGGAVLFGFRPRGDVAALILVATVFGAVMVALGLALFSLFRSDVHALVVCNIVAMVMAGLGGAFGPVAGLPTAMQGAALASPAYWAIEAMTSLSLDGGGFVEVLPTVAVLMLWTAGLIAFAALRLRRGGGGS